MNKYYYKVSIEINKYCVEDGVEVKLTDNSDSWSCIANFASQQEAQRVVNLMYATAGSNLIYNKDTGYDELIKQ